MKKNVILSEKVVLSIDSMPELNPRVKLKMAEICRASQPCDFGRVMKEYERDAADQRKEMEQKSTSHRLDPLLVTY